jgi:hypothetical protein
MANNTHLITTRLHEITGTIAGTSFTLLNINFTSITTTVIMAAIAATTSFIVTYSLKQMVNYFKKFRMNKN